MPLITPPAFKRNNIVSSLYSQTVIADGPISYWKLNESTGTVATDTMGNYDGVYEGAPTLGVTGAIANSNETAVYFDAVDDQVAADELVLPALGSWSVEGWFKYEPASIERIAVGRGKDTDPAGAVSYGWSMQVGLTATEVTNATVFDTPSITSFNASVTGSYTSGVFYHIVSVFVEGDGLYTYINGVQAAYLAVSSTRLRQSAFEGTWIGSNSKQGLSNPGTIDHVSMYRFALSAGQVSAHYAAGI